MNIITSPLINLLGNNQLNWNFYFGILTISFFIINILITRRTVNINYFFLFLIYLTYLILMWIPNLHRDFLNPDEVQWLIHAKEINYNPLLWFKNFFIINIGRVGTILPLSILFSVFQTLDEIVLLRVTSVILLTICAIITFRITKLITSDISLSMYYSCILCIVFANFQFYDFVAYNSEIVTISILLLLMLTFIDIILGRLNKFKIFVITLLIYLLPFVKDQSSPISVILTAFLFLYLYRKNKNFLKIFIYFNLLITALVFTLLATSGSLIFFKDIIYNTLLYAELGVIGEKQNFEFKLRCLYQNFVREDFRPIFYPMMVYLFLPLLGLSRYKNKVNFYKDKIFLFNFLIFLVISLIIYYPGNQCPHYGIYLFVPFIIWGSIILNSYNKSFRNIFLASIIIVCFSQPERHEGVDELYKYGKNKESHKFTSYIKKNSTPNDRLMIWGWKNEFYIETNLRIGSRWLYPTFATGTKSNAHAMRSLYVIDLNALKPKFIIEWMGDNTRYFTGKYYAPLKNYPELYHIIQRDYKLVISEGTKNLYERIT